MNFSRAYVLETVAAAVAAAVFPGCGPGDGSAEFDRGMKLFEEKKFSLAAVEFAESSRLAPGGANALLMEARAKLAAGDKAGAVKAAKAGLALAPDAPDAIEIAAQTLFFAGDAKASSELFSRLAEGGGFSPSERSAGFSGLGAAEMAAVSSGNIEVRRETARGALLRALRLDPSNAPARYNLAMLYRDTFGYPGPALDQFALYARIDKSGSGRVVKVREKIIPELKASMAAETARRVGEGPRDSVASSKSLRTAVEAMEKKRYPAAYAAYAAAFKQDPSNAQAALGLAEAAFKRTPGKAGAAEAFKYARAAAALRPGSKEILLRAGTFAAKAGNEAGAIEAYSRALAVSPSDAQTALALENSYIRAGKKRAAESVREYRKSLSAK